MLYYYFIFCLNYSISFIFIIKYRLAFTLNKSRISFNANEIFTEHRVPIAEPLENLRGTLVIGSNTHSLQMYVLERVFMSNCDYER